jgi:hypothetical protein
MRTYLLAMATAAALFAIPTTGFSQGVEFGPGGVRIDPGHHHRGDYQRRRSSYGGGECRELRQACMHKEELGEQGMGNCRRYREMCGR